MAYLEGGQAKKAITVLQRVVEIRKKTLVEDDPVLLSSQQGLAMAYHANAKPQTRSNYLGILTKERGRL